METDFMSSHDGENFPLPQLYDQGMLEDSDSSLMDMIRSDFSLPITHIANPQNFWEPQEDSYEATSVSTLEEPTTPNKDYFQKMLSEWQIHLDTMATSEEDVDLPDMIGVDIRFPKSVTEEMPNDLFDVSNMDLKPSGLYPISNILGMDTWNLSTFNLENFLENDDVEEQKFGLIVAEEESMEAVKEQQLKEAPEIEESLQEKKEDVESSKAVEDAKAKVVDGSTEELTAPSVAKQGPEKSEPEDESVDIETVVEQIPVLEAGDLKSLLEQFEATEEFNSRRESNKSGGVSNVPAVQSNSAVSSTAPSKDTKKVCNNKPVTTPAITSSLHETIRDSLPQEVIDRIKASNRRKTIPLIPAMPSKKAARGTRMQDAGATLNRNKLLKLVSGAGKGEAVQLDHDYCTSSGGTSSDVAPPKSFYHSNASEYISEQSQDKQASANDTEERPGSKSPAQDTKVYSRLPEYYVVLAPQKRIEKNKKLNSIKDEMWDKNSRKDSGLESGEVSDASEETGNVCMSASTGDSKCPERKTGVKGAVPFSGGDKKNSVDIKSMLDRLDKKCVSSVAWPSEGSQSVLKDWSSPNKPSKPVAMVSVLKRNQPAAAIRPQQSLLISSNSPANVPPPRAEEPEKKPEGPKKKKLNLEEYRTRIKELDRTRNIKSNENAKTQVVASTNTSMSNEGTQVAPAAVVSASEAVQGDTVNGAATVSEAAEAVAVEKSARPVMHSVEVQTQASLFDETDEKAGMQPERRSRKKQRQSFTKRDSSSSSSHSTASTHSHRRRKSRSQRRRRTSRRRSASSSGSQQPRSRSNSTHSSSSYSSRSRSPMYRKCEWIPSEREKQRQVEERRVIYVGRIDEGTSKAELRRRFELFGPIIDISVHFREHGDNYGFVTFAYKVDAYEAVEHGNDDPSLPRYDLCFGGRRAFCKTRYADLDGIATTDDRGYTRLSASTYKRCNTQSDDFDLLLREAQAKLRKRKV